MRRRGCGVGFFTAALVLGMAMGATGLHAAEWHVSPEGTPGGDGSAAQPWDLRTALRHPPAVRPGDTILLHGGRYIGEKRDTFTSQLKGAGDAPIIVRPAPGERAIISPTLTLGGAHTWYRDFEVENPDPNEYERYDHARWPAVWTGAGESLKLINLVIHGGGQGIGAWQSSFNLEIYGCIIFHNGWAGSNQGHAIYTQNKEGAKHIVDNIMFNQLGTGYGVHAYGSKRAAIQNFVFEGNCSFSNGGSNFLVGGCGPAANCVVRDNFSWGGNGVRIGYTGHNRNVEVRDNYFATKFSVHNWDAVTLEGNTIVGAGPVVRLDIRQLAQLPKYAWDRNACYNRTAPEKGFLLMAPEGNRTMPLADWRAQTDADAKSTLVAGVPKGVKVFVRPNRYQKGRAHIIIFNWENRDAVAVDVSAVLQKGDRFELYDVENLLGKPVLTGTYAGGAIRAPMNLTEVMQPVTRQRFGHTPPEFGVFLLRLRTDG